MHGPRLHRVLRLTYFCVTFAAKPTDVEEEVLMPDESMEGGGASAAAGGERPLGKDPKDVRDPNEISNERMLQLSALTTQLWNHIEK